jgi:DNA-repair protein complementing XP-A cells
MISRKWSIQKGGFLMNEGGEADEDVRRKEKEREGKQRTQHNLEIRELLRRFFPKLWSFNLHVPAMFLDPSLNPHCRECNSMDVDPTFLKVFKCLVCKKCQNEKPEKYGLLTKTECREVCIRFCFEGFMFILNRIIS